MKTIGITKKSFIATEVTLYNDFSSDAILHYSDTHDQKIEIEFEKKKGRTKYVENMLEINFNKTQGGRYYTIMKVLYNALLQWYIINKKELEFLCSSDPRQKLYDAETKTLRIPSEETDLRYSNRLILTEKEDAIVVRMDERAASEGFNGFIVSLDSRYKYGSELTPYPIISSIMKSMDEYSMYSFPENNNIIEKSSPKGYVKK